MESERSHFLERAKSAVVPVSLATIALLLLSAAIGAFAHPETRRILTRWTGAPVEAAYKANADTGTPLLRFTVAGDIGTGDSEEYETAAAMTKLLLDGPIDGLILLGDNVYPNGDPDRLNETVFIPFGSLLYSGTDLLPVLGNHDIQDGNGPGHLAALGMPGNWYSRAFGDVLFIGLDSNQAANPEQAQWLEDTLSSSQAQWKIVAMHHPPYSAGLHGSHKPSLETLVPLFEKHGVDLVLSGHDHDYQRSRVINGVTYVVSGGGSKTRPTSAGKFTEVSWSIHHFVELRVYEDQIVGEAYAQDGRVFDYFAVAK